MDQNLKTAVESLRKAIGDGAKTGDYVAKAAKVEQAKTAHKAFLAQQHEIALVVKAHVQAVSDENGSSKAVTITDVARFVWSDFPDQATWTKIGKLAKTDADRPKSAALWQARYAALRRILTYGQGKAETAKRTIADVALTFVALATVKALSDATFAAVRAHAIAAAAERYEVEPDMLGDAIGAFDKRVAEAASVLAEQDAPKAAPRDKAPTNERQIAKAAAAAA